MINNIVEFLEDCEDAEVFYTITPYEDFVEIIIDGKQAWQLEALIKKTDELKKIFSDVALSIIKVENNNVHLILTFN